MYVAPGVAPRAAFVVVAHRGTLSGMTQQHQPAGYPAAVDAVDAVMLAMRVLVAVTAQSVANLDERVTLPQLRVLVVIASQGPQNLVAVANGLGVHPSNATRACDKLVEAGLLDRSDNPADRRNLVLRLTPSGEDLVETMNRARRRSIAGILAGMSERGRTRLASALSEFVEASGEIPTSKAWALGLTTESPVSGGNAA